MWNPFKSVAKPIKFWQEAFDDSRRRGHNTDAYTFQIAWAYARESLTKEEIVERFLAEYGNKLADVMGIESYDIADRDAKIRAMLDV